MEKQTPFIPQLLLKNIQIYHQSLNSKSTHRGPNSNRHLIKNYLTRQNLQQCLSTFDIFKEIIEDPLQLNKLVRDVSKTIHLKIYDQQAIIYNNGDPAQSIYMVIKGAVSLCLRTIKTTEEADENIQNSQNQQQVQYDYQEVVCFEEGEGFGQVEFIHKTKRNLVAKVKRDNTVLGIIDARGFEQIIQMYRQRVYYKKKDMFFKCPLLKMLQPYQMQFIVNNAKPVTFTISKQIVLRKQTPKCLYLIMEGQVQLRQQTRKEKPELYRYSTKQKNSLEQIRGNKIKIKNVVVGVLEQGAFLGDCELALNRNYNFTAICKSQKVKAYTCDQRIIMSQMNEQSFQFAQKYYNQKHSYRQNKLTVFKQAKSKIQKQLQTHDVVVLNQQQINIKRKIMNRYVEKTPTLIGQLSPREIGRMVDRKYAKIKSEPSEKVSLPSFPILKSPPQRLVRNQRAFSPLLKRYQQLRQSVQSEKLSEINRRLKPIRQTPVSHHKKIQAMPIEQFEFIRSQTRPLLIFLRPFYKKVESLHERLSRQYSTLKKQNQLKLQKSKVSSESSIMDSKRVCEFINKVKKHKQLQEATIE